MYPLLHALTRGSLADFFLRVSVLEALVADARGPITPSELTNVLYWLNDASRDNVIRTLRESGWMTFEGASGYRISPAGQFVATVISFLRSHSREDDLRPTVEGIDYMIRLGVDPIRQVLLLRSRLEDLRNEMERARSSHSEVILRAAAAKISEALELSERIRDVLGHVSFGMVEARQAAQDVHELLSRLHGVSSDLHSAITEVGRQYLQLVAGLSTSDIVGTLMQLPVEELANVARISLRPVFRRPTFVVPELLGANAEAYLSRNLRVQTITAWSDPPQTESESAATEIPDEIRRFIEDLDRLIREELSELLSTFIPKESVGESFLRASLLPLVSQGLAGEGVAGRLGAMGLNVSVDSDGNLAKAALPLSEISAGKVGAPKEVCNE